ncbi:hypothetical protein EVAR_4576_1 [Eumeta japonica]|uniref:Mariner Mos1 transposase n=1 Tax=Eumeta variegata TaxID=151549 RepID=A0A4C1SWW8_EUMVA|nr:hypothetical protein EVAR_4576_1 [Eumeta japonica]
MHIREGTTGLSVEIDLFQFQLATAELFLIVSPRGKGTLKPPEQSDQNVTGFWTFTAGHRSHLLISTTSNLRTLQPTVAHDLDQAVSAPRDSAVSKKASTRLPAGKVIVTISIVLHHDNASCHASVEKTQFSEGQNIELTSHPLYSSDFVPKREEQITRTHSMDLRDADIVQVYSSVLRVHFHIELLLFILNGNTFENFP